MPLTRQETRENYAVGDAYRTHRQCRSPQVWHLTAAWGAFSGVNTVSLLQTPHVVLGSTALYSQGPS
jgi:hypothetical protein